MPMFEYKCLECDNKFEELVLRGDMIIKCPGCSSANVQKQVSGFSSSSTPGGGSCSPSSCGKSSHG